MQIKKKKKETEEEEWCRSTISHQVSSLWDEPHALICSLLLSSDYILAEDEITMTVFFTNEG